MTYGNIVTSRILRGSPKPHPKRPTQLATTFFLAVFIGFPATAWCAAEHGKSGSGFAQAVQPSTECEKKDLATGAASMRMVDSWITAAALIDQRSRAEDSVLLDVRDPHLFRGLRIPGSINVPLYAVKTKEFLKRKPVVLIFNGFDVTTVTAELQLLRKVGFDRVVALEGGLSAWASLGGPLEGDEVWRSKLQTISPTALFLEKGREACMFVGVDPVPDKPADGLLANALSIPLSSDRDVFLQRLRDAIQLHGGPGYTAVVLFHENDAGYEELTFVPSHYRSLSPAPVGFYFLEGGLERYRKFVAQQDQITQRTGLKVTKGCGTCP